MKRLSLDVLNKGVKLKPKREVREGTEEIYANLGFLPSGIS